MYVKSIIIVTLAAPLLIGCSALLPSPTPAQPVAAADISPAPESIQLKTARTLAAPQPEREDVNAESRFGDAEFRRSQAQALDGDRHAAMRVARMYAEGSHGVPRDERRMVLWLKHASTLDHAAASYQLYLYYLERGLDRDAVRYERRALRQGYVLPVRLGNKRG
jgi:TPR repeat protein